MDSTALATEPFVNITTFKRDGTPVSVPVWCVADNGTLLVFSEADSWKVKRIRRDAHVRLAPCSARGTPRGPAVDADASLEEETTRIRALLVRKYPWAWPAYRALMPGAHVGDGGDPARPTAGAVAVADDQDHTPLRRGRVPAPTMAIVHPSAVAPPGEGRLGERWPGGLANQGPLAPDGGPGLGESERRGEGGERT
jgi:uncharacterized protein